jgi:hypothetical protein
MPLLQNPSPPQKKKKSKCEEEKEQGGRHPGLPATGDECGTRIRLQAITNYNFNYWTLKEKEERRKNKKKQVPQSHTDDADQLEVAH